MRLPVLPVHAYDCTINWEYLARTQPGAAQTELPNGTDGQEIYYLADSTNGVVWHLRFRAGSTSIYKWEFLGGSPLADYVVGTGACTAANGFTNTLNDFADVGVTCPLAGDYLATTNIGVASNNTAGGYCEAGPQVNGATINAVDMSTAYQSAADTGQSLTRIHRLTVATAGTKIWTYYHTFAGTASFGRRRLDVVPFRVG